MRINGITSQPSKLTKSKARLIAHLKADGYVGRCGKRKTNYWIALECGNKGELKKFERDILDIYGLRAKWALNESGKKPGTYNWKVFIRSKLAYEDLQRYGPYDSYSWKVPQEIKAANKAIKAEFIRAFFDDEATVLPKCRIIRLYSINLKGLTEILHMLREFGICGKIYSGFGLRRNIFGLEIRGQKNIGIFREEINFSIPEKTKKLSLIKFTRRRAPS